MLPFAQAEGAAVEAAEEEERPRASLAGRRVRVGGPDRPMLTLPGWDRRSFLAEEGRKEEEQEGVQRGVQDRVKTAYDAQGGLGRPSMGWILI